MTSRVWRLTYQQRRRSKKLIWSTSFNRSRGLCQTSLKCSQKSVSVASPRCTSVALGGKQIHFFILPGVVKVCHTGKAWSGTEHLIWRKTSACSPSSSEPPLMLSRTQNQLRESKYNFNSSIENMWLFRTNMSLMMAAVILTRCTWREYCLHPVLLCLCSLITWVQPTVPVNQ